MNISNFQFDRSGPMPLYHQLAEQIKQAIAAGLFAAGDKLPTEVEFVSATNLSQITVRQALDHLVRQGLIVRERGRGTFVRNLSSGNDAKQKTTSYRRIAAVLPWSSTSIFGQVMTGIEDVAFQRGYQLMLVNNCDDSRIEMQKLREAIDHGMDGMIWAPPTRGTNPTMVFRLSDKGLPVVAVDRMIAGVDMPIDTIVSDNTQALNLAINHLIECGCQQLAYLEDASAKTTSRHERRDAMLEACQLHHLPEPVMFCSRKSFLDNGRAAADQLRRSIEQIDGVITQSGPAAVGFVERMGQHNIRVPEDIQVVGFDCNCLDTFTPMPVTGITQDFHAMGVRAAEVLIGRIEGKINYHPTIEHISVSLQIQATTKPISVTYQRQRQAVATSCHPK